MTLKGKRGHAKKGAEIGNPLANGRKPLLQETEEDALTRFRGVLQSGKTKTVQKEIEKTPDKTMVLAKLLCADERVEVRRGVIAAFDGVSKSLQHIPLILPGLSVGILDPDTEVRRNAILCLGGAVIAGNGKNIDFSPALPSLGIALSSADAEHRARVARTTGFVAMESDIKGLVPKIISLLGDGFTKVGEHASGALSYYVGRHSRNPEKMTRLANLISEFMHSERLQREMAANSPYYERSARAIADILAQIKKAEGKTA